MQESNQPQPIDNINHLIISSQLLQNKQPNTTIPTTTTITTATITSNNLFSNLDKKYIKPRSAIKFYPEIKQAISPEAPEFFMSNTMYILNPRKHKLYNANHAGQYAISKHCSSNSNNNSALDCIDNSSCIHGRKDPNLEQSYSIRDGFLNKVTYHESPKCKIYNCLLDIETEFQAPPYISQEGDMYKELYTNIEQSPKGFNRPKSRLMCPMEDSYAQFKYIKYLRDNNNEFPKEPPIEPSECCIRLYRMHKSSDIKHNHQNYHPNSVDKLTSKKQTGQNNEEAAVLQESPDVSEIGLPFARKSQKSNQNNLTLQKIIWKTENDEPINNNNTGTVTTATTLSKFKFSQTPINIQKSFPRKSFKSSSPKKDNAPSSQSSVINSNNEISRSKYSDHIRHSNYTNQNQLRIFNGSHTKVKADMSKSDRECCSTNAKNHIATELENILQRELLEKYLKRLNSNQDHIKKKSVSLFKDDYSPNNNDNTISNQDNQNQPKLIETFENNLRNLTPKRQAPNNAFYRFNRNMYRMSPHQQKLS